MTTFKVGYLIGSLATGSINRKLAKALIRLAPESLQFTEIPFGDRRSTATIMTRIIRRWREPSRPRSRHRTRSCS